MYFNLFNWTKSPKEEDLNKVREWLIWAVAEAEKQLGSGTGQLKLRLVYNMFVMAFPKLVDVISFKFFSEMVDVALGTLKLILNENEQIKNYVSKF